MSDLKQITVLAECKNGKKEILNKTVAEGDSELISDDELTLSAMYMCSRKKMKLLEVLKIEYI